MLAMHIIVMVISQILIINQYFGQRIGMDGMAMPDDLHVQFSKFNSYFFLFFFLFLFANAYSPDDADIS